MTEDTMNRIRTKWEGPLHDQIAEQQAEIDRLTEALQAMYDCRWQSVNLSSVQRAHDLAVAILGKPPRRRGTERGDV